MGMIIESPTFEPVTAFCQRLNLAVSDAAFEHPEAAVDAAGDFIGGFDVVDLDVHHAETDADFGIKFLERS